jgi:hypothetical protein
MIFPTGNLRQRPISCGRSVGHYVLVSSSLWNLWPDNIFCLKVAVLCGAPYLTRGQVCLLSVSHKCLVHCQRFNTIYIVRVTCFKYMQYILELCQHGLSTAGHAKIYATSVYTLETCLWNLCPATGRLLLVHDSGSQPSYHNITIR